MDINDFSYVMDKESVKKLVTNGCLASDDGKQLLILRSSEINDQVFADDAAPIDVKMRFEVVDLTTHDIVEEIVTRGAPGQAYNIAATKFERMQK